MNDALTITRRRALQALKPPPVLPLADWIESNIHFPATVSALPGKVRLWSYQRGICDAIDDPAISRITVQKSARIGYTSLLTAVIANYVANQPCPILAVLPTQDDCRDYAVGDIEGTFEASPALRGLLDAEADETGRSTLMSKTLPRGQPEACGRQEPPEPAAAQRQNTLP